MAPTMMGLPTDFLALSGGILLLLGPAIAFEYSLQPLEAPPPPGTGPPPALITQNVTVLDNSGSTGEGQSTDLTAELPAAVVVRIAGTLTWTDDIGSNDEFSLTFALDGAELGKDQGTSGSLVVEAKAPPGGSISGNLTITVECLRAPGVIQVLPVDRDSGNSWDLKVEAEIVE